MKRPAGRKGSPLLDTYGLWTVVYSNYEKKSNGKFGEIAHVVCVCGNIKSMPAVRLRAGRAKSCANCARRNVAGGWFRRDFPLRRRLMCIVLRIISRCHSPDDSNYSQYGARGVTVYDEWRNDPELFCKYLISLPNALCEGYSIDRIEDSDNRPGNYQPGNLRWADALTQQINTRRKMTRIAELLAPMPEPYRTEAIERIRGTWIDSATETPPPAV